ncbi:MAG: hypothetical protein R3249_11275, partial [Nitriliruptorales bacterium]|nr:hypothetical protein [Nitriliruptorales bacterium]
MSRRFLLAVLVVLVAAGVPALPAGADPTPLGLTCAPISEGVRHCPNDGDGQRVPSFDGVPIDVDVTLPLTGSGPWPTIVMLPGMAAEKGQFQRNVEPAPSDIPPGPPNTTHNDNIWFASRGYAVVNPSPRGWGNSCGSGPLGLGIQGGAKLQTGPCAEGFWRALDARYDARDMQHLLGLLVDQGISLPTKNGATGFSGGGLISSMLGALNDRVMCDGVDRGDLCDGVADGDLVAWTSPAGTPMAMGAIHSNAAATDLIGSLLVNGRFLDFDDATIDMSIEPPGIFIQSFTDALLVLAEANGYVRNTGSGDESDVEMVVASWNAGEPYAPFMEAVHEGFLAHHASLGIQGEPAPMLLQNGFSDDILPIREALKLYNDLHRRFEHPDVALLFGDHGHSRSGNRDGAAVAFNDIATAFFDSRLKGEGDGPAP